MISKFQAEYIDGGSFRIRRKASKADIEMLRAHRAEIIAELKRREEEKEEAHREAEAAKAAKIAAIKSGELKIKISFRDGEYYSGYAVYDEEAELLAEIGAAKNISGWGYAVSDKVIEALGEEFTLQQAAEVMKPEKEEKAEKKAAKEAEIAAKFAEARETGSKILIRKRMDDCHSKDESCSMDMVYEYAMPDGTTKTEREHCW